MIELLRDIEMDKGGTEDLTPENIFGSHRSTKQSKLIKAPSGIIKYILW